MNLSTANLLLYSNVTPCGSTTTVLGPTSDNHGAMRNDATKGAASSSGSGIGGSHSSLVDSSSGSNSVDVPVDLPPPPLSTNLPLTSPLTDPSSPSSLLPIPDNSPVQQHQHFSGSTSTAIPKTDDLVINSPISGTATENSSYQSKQTQHHNNNAATYQYELFDSTVIVFGCIVSMIIWLTL